MATKKTFLVALSAHSAVGASLIKVGKVPAGWAVLFRHDGVMHPVIFCTAFDCSLGAGFVRIVRTPVGSSEGETYLLHATEILFSYESSSEGLPVGFSQE